MGISHLPNLITFSRIGLTPVLILFLREHDYATALAIFVLAGVSDALDGWIAKHFRYTTRLGAILDPLADKLLLVSAYITLMLLGELPFWLVLCVVFRDVVIVGGYLVYTTVVGTVRMHPTILSKFNTLAQIGLVVLLLGQKALNLAYPGLTELMIYVVLVTTVASGVHYIWIWGVMKEVPHVQTDNHAQR